MSGVDLDEVASRARIVLAHDHRQLPRDLARDALAMVEELVVHRETTDGFENLLATADAERVAAARSAEMWKQKAADGLGVDVTLRLVGVHGEKDGCVVLTRRYPDLDVPAVFHDCLTCCVTWEDGRG